MPWPMNGPSFRSMLSPQSLCYRRYSGKVREQWHKLILISPLWRNQPWVSELFQLLIADPVTDPLEKGPPLSSERDDMASTARVMGPACVAARREPFGLPQRVLNTMAKARAPFTRCLYALKWSIFSAWCQDRDLDPSPPTCQWFFHFCRRCWTNTALHPPSSLRGIHSGFPRPIAGRSVGRDSVVIQLVRGARIPRVLIQFHLGTYQPY